MTIAQSLLQLKNIAVVGCSDNPARASYYVSEYLLSAGYRLFPVNPAHTQILQQTCYPNLSAIHQKVDLVLIFRRSEHVLPIVQESIQIGAKAIWMQDGVINTDAAALAEKAGLSVVMNDCIMRQHASSAR